jgi:hypothetical protein
MGNAASDFQSIGNAFESAGNAIADGVTSAANTVADGFNNEIIHGFENNIIRPADTFFNDTIPSFADVIQDGFNNDFIGAIEDDIIIPARNLAAQLPAAAQSGFDAFERDVIDAFQRDVIAPSSTLFNETLPGVIQQAMEGFDDAVIQGSDKFFTETLPGGLGTFGDLVQDEFLNPAGSALDSFPGAFEQIGNEIANTIGGGFKDEIINPSQNFFENTIPQAGAAFAEDFQRDIIDAFQRDIIDGFQNDIINGFQEDIIDGFQRDIVDGFQRDIIDGFQENVIDGFERDIIDPSRTFFQETLPDNFTEYVINPIVENVPNFVTNTLPSGLETGWNWTKDALGTATDWLGQYWQYFVYIIGALFGAYLLYEFAPDIGKKIAMLAI